MRAIPIVATLLCVSQAAHAQELTAEQRRRKTSLPAATSNFAGVSRRISLPN